MIPASKRIGMARRKLGGMVGQFTVPADFDAPLPEDVMDGFEGA